MLNILLTKIKQKYKFLFWVIIVVVLLVGLSQLISFTSTQNPQLIINEFVAVNNTGLTDEDGDYVDWIEIYNPSSTSVNLSGWTLTDDKNQPEKWAFPNMTLAAQDYLVVFASGKNRKSTGPDTPLHTNFRLDSQGEFIGLYNILDNKFVAPEFSTQYQDIAYGQSGDMVTYGYLLEATPGQPNSSLLWVDEVTPINFSTTRGFYTTPFTLTLKTSTPGATIHYTIDGSEPTASHGQPYTEPLYIDSTTLVRATAVKPNYRPVDVATQSYIFLDDVLLQPANPPGFPSTWGIHDETIKGFVAGDVVHADYEMDPDIVSNPEQRQALLAGLQAIPSVSIVTEMQNLDIYSSPREEGRAWERPASFELIDPTRLDQNMQINAGIRIHGDLGRREYMHKHSFRLLFRSEYGAGQLEYPIFTNSPVNKFETLILRGGVQDSYLGLQGLRRRNATYTRDEWMRTSQQRDVELWRIW